ncbi:hypothetical protein [Paenibacillus bouchesdurhonensis]|uniref:hypothetical protein n=1 Tax=Paenibacillus bouchesdurhonensis TaxID=1870990 RepID=UPI000DA6109C|nr:hypothetical protein [Paenibacillus bouchesdurhonensis]
MIHMRRSMAQFSTAVLALFMIFSIPYPALNQGHIANLGQGTVKVDQALRNSENKAFHSSVYVHFSSGLIPLYLLVLPAAACSLLALAGAYFRPFFYQRMKRILLLPIKFTSMYAA